MVLSFRTMTLSDVPFALELVKSVGWDLTRLDIERNLFFEPMGCFIVSQDSVNIGIINSFTYGKVGFIGNVIVSPDYRGKGVGREMMLHVMNRLRNRRVTSIRLDAVPKAITFYKNLGFKHEWPSLRFRIEAKEMYESKSEPILSSDLMAVSAFDSKYFGLNRFDKLKEILKEFPNYCYKSTLNNRVVGYIMARDVSNGVKIGPWICEPENTNRASQLLETILTIVHGKILKIGVPEPNTSSVRIIKEFGFSQLPSSFRMCAGDCERVERIEGIYGIGAPDKG